jgi:hypothetical protein
MYVYQMPPTIHLFAWQQRSFCSAISGDLVFLLKFPSERPPSGLGGLGRDAYAEFVLAGLKREARLRQMSRPPTMLLENVDARHKAGHDELGASA